ncbi:MAG TPA: glycosyltransferase [Candidatus Saccharimonadales bacterium]|nr:glycosyltransferase [Candidatus Saccharimonadales bacterium]
MSVWHALNLLSGFGLGTTWLYHTLAARRGIPQIPELTHSEYAVPAATKLPRVSVIVPARNEVAMIEPAVRSLLTIDYPDYEVVVVDDRSEDGTGVILDRLQAEYGGRLVVVHVRELPPGWLGKTHAMWSAAQASTGEWILFSDADVVHAPEALRRAVHYAEQQQAGHMVLLPTMQMESIGERMMISFFQAMFIFAYRPWKVRDPEARDSMGVGAFNLVRRTAYEKIGTYESIRLSVVDDMRMGEKAKQAGIGCCVAFGENMVRIRWAVGARGVVKNLTKNFFAQLHYNLPFAIAAAMGLLWLHLGPWLGTAFATGWARAGYAVALGSLLAIYVAMGRRTKISIGYVLLHPAASVLMVFALFRSTVLTLLHGGVEWRGTFYPLDELKKGS